MKGHGITARKSLGQNFLHDMNITRKIVRAAGGVEGKTVIEIGPGPGGLTKAILEAGAARLVAIELDKRAVELLKSWGEERLEVMEADALKVDLRKITPGPVMAIANLPYNVATELLVRWLDYPEFFESLTLMFQKEVAARIVAKKGSKDYGRLAVLTQWLCEAKILFDVPREAFVPRPKITSSIVLLRPRPEPLAPASAVALKTLLREAFGQRRKMLRSSLRKYGESIEKSGIDLERRPEDLSVEEFCVLAGRIS